MQGIKKRVLFIEKLCFTLSIMFHSIHNVFIYWIGIDQVEMQGTLCLFLFFDRMQGTLFELKS